ncbi:MAG: hydantoinase/oxoprolinase family protein, partial [Acidimicrobiia bacterium]
VLEVVEAHMERAIRAVSVEQGVDPRASTLVAFGGAGGLHAVSLARRLGMSRVALPPHGGVFSALGLLMAPPRHDVARSVMIRSEQASTLDVSLAAISTRAEADFLNGQGAPPTQVELVADARYVGQAHEIPLTLDRGRSFHQVVEQFHAAHRDINGFARPDDPIEVVTVRAVASGRPILAWEDLPEAGTGPAPVPRRRQVMVADNEVELDVWWRDELPGGLVVHGPCVIEETVGTIFLEAGDRARVFADGTLEVSW